MRGVDVDDGDRLADLRRQVYSRGAHPDAETVERLRQLTESQDASAQAVGESGGQPVNEPSEAVVAESIPRPDAGDALAAEPDSDAVPGRARHRRRELSALVAVALVLGIGAGVGIGLGLAPRQEAIAPRAGGYLGPASSGAPIASADPDDDGIGGMGEPEHAAYLRFEAPQTSADIFLTTLPATIIGESTRALFGSLEGEQRGIFVAMSRAGKTCVLAATPPGEVVSACVSEEEFAVHGLRLDWTTTVDKTEELGQGAHARRTHSVHWRANGKAEYLSSPIADAVP
ncbi:hypothetical protein [Homoserinimonas hongtaonis]|uniref:Uncharacterized protein n=1 Tax=Homoserinimonas hongtaonis TaxID=2079791 RepID=A0A2U1T037_9MICO|nr:hypothetical protein [Salinibacterium hongtaonis]PWB97241.1 hypothetical protein DF220_04905 [Salinibacterium hongtaonis]